MKQVPRCTISVYRIPMRHDNGNGLVWQHATVMTPHHDMHRVECARKTTMSAALPIHQCSTMKTLALGPYRNVWYHRQAHCEKKNRTRVKPMLFLKRLQGLLRRCVPGGPEISVLASPFLQYFFTYGSMATIGTKLFTITWQNK